LGGTENIRVCHASRGAYSGTDEMVTSPSWNSADRLDNHDAISDEIVEDLPLIGPGQLVEIPKVGISHISMHFIFILAI
jgi:hypothetical protein